jgi:hypothetical protein
MYAVDILRRDHQQVQNLMSKAEKTLNKDNATAFAGAVEQLDDAINLHFRITESFGEVRELIAAARETHNRINESMIYPASRLSPKLT